MIILLAFQNQAQSENSSNGIASQSEFNIDAAAKVKASPNFDSAKLTGGSLQAFGDHRKKIEVPTKLNEKEAEQEKNGDDVPQIKIHF